MANVNLGVLRQLEPQELWSPEGAHFTPWLAAHVDQAGAALGAHLELLQREADVGDLSLDLAKDLGTGRNVIIQNQRVASDHDHRGKLITYAAGFEAATTVLVVPNLRDEHRQALEWLNARTDEDTSFFAVVVEVVRIDESQPAVNQRVAVAPHDWSSGALKPRQTPEREESCRRFFHALIEELPEGQRFTNARVGQPHSWYAFASAHRGVKYSAAFASANRLRAELYIDSGDRDATKRLFDTFLAGKGVIEGDLGSQLQWERLDAKQAWPISLVRDGSILDGDEKQQEYRQWLVRNLVEFRRVFGPLLADASLGTDDHKVTQSLRWLKGVN